VTFCSEVSFCRSRGGRSCGGISPWNSDGAAGGRDLGFTPRSAENLFACRSRDGGSSFGSPIEGSSFFGGPLRLWLPRPSKRFRNRTPSARKKPGEQRSGFFFGQSPILFQSSSHEGNVLREVCLGPMQPCTGRLTSNRFATNPRRPLRAPALPQAPCLSPSTSNFLHPTDLFVF
jgi:hypothetical protein